VITAFSQGKFGRISKEANYSVYRWVLLIADETVPPALVMELLRNAMDTRK
jgi:hypothetical protein